MSLNFFGLRRRSRPSTPPPAVMDLDQPPFLPPLDLENQQQQQQQYQHQYQQQPEQQQPQPQQQQQAVQPAEWNALPPSPPPTINVKPDEQPSNLDLAALFEQRCRSWIDAISNQDFGPDSALWEGKAPNWKSRRACNFMKDQMEPLDLQQFIESNKQGAAFNPNVRLSVLDCTTNMYKNDHGKIEFAESFLNVEVTGAPPGITRRSVAVYNWRLIGGRWLSTSHKSLPGMVVMGPDSMY